MNRKNFFGILFLSLLLLCWTSCKDKKELPTPEEKSYSLTFEKLAYEVRLGWPSDIAVKSGNKSYTVTPENPDILEATAISQQNGNAPGAVKVTGKKSGETIVSVLDNIIQEEVKLQIKVTDFYLGHTVTESSHSLFTKEQRLFLVKNDNKHFYIFPEKTKDPQTLVTVGNYELTTLATKTYLTLKAYAANKQEVVTCKFDLSGTDQETLTLLAQYLSGKEIKDAVPAGVVHILKLEEEKTGKEVQLALDFNEEIPEGILNGEKIPDTPAGLFPVEDNSVPLPGSEAARFKVVLDRIDAESCLVMGDTKISDSEYQIIKDFTDELVQGITAPYQLYQKIFYWVADNIQYGFEGNDAYDVFINRKAVCEGYSNLLKVMLLSQNIPTLVVHGDIQWTSLEAHAWNYSYFDGVWYVGDATNSQLFRLNSEVDVRMYEKKYFPYFTDIVITEDENFVYGYQNGICIRKIKNVREKLTLPFSVMGYQVETIYLTDFPDGIKEFYVGSNIRNLGENAIGLRGVATTLENIFIAGNNETFESYEGSIYRKYEDIPYYIPENKTVIQLKPVETASKNIVVDHKGVVELYFGMGTKTIENFAVENCPNLKRVYIPSSVARIDENAFYRVGEIAQIRY